MSQDIWGGDSSLGTFQREARSLQAWLLEMLGHKVRSWWDIRMTWFSPANTGIGGRAAMRDITRICFLGLKKSHSISCLKFNLIMHSLKTSDGDD